MAIDRAEVLLRLAEEALKEARLARREIAEIRVIQGPPGPRGDPGLDGNDGAPGEPGKDGVITKKVTAWRGVWKEGETYTLGDFATWAGSTWHCDAEETGIKPGNGDGWTLAVKHGRDGKNGKDGERGPEGKEGRPGKDWSVGR